jgi:DNA-binding protein HU-beta
MHVNKAELVNRISEKVGISKKQAEDAIESFTDIVMNVLKDGGEVTIAGFGAFSAKQRAGRMGVNPQNPTEKIQIPPVIVPKFKAGKALKDILKKPKA